MEKKSVILPNCKKNLHIYTEKKKINDRSGQTIYVPVA